MLRILPIKKLVLLLLTLLARAAEAPPKSAYDSDSGEVARILHYNQAVRPQFPYTPVQGVIGDATGLIVYAG